MLPERLPPLSLRTRGLIALVLATGLLLRLWHLDHGLPDLLEEALPFKLALGMFRDHGAIDWNPHFFNYPSLSIYLHLLVQRAMVMGGTLAGAWHGPADYLLLSDLDPRPAVLAARALSVACELVTLLCVARIGERLRPGAGLIAAALLAMSPTAILTSRAIFTDTMMTAFATLALERLLLWRAEQRPHQLAWAALSAGLAASAKYPGAFVLLPFAAVLIERHGARGAGLWIGACAVAALAFVVTSPFVMIDFASFARDFRYESRHVSEGHFGSLDRHGLGYVLRTLLDDLGPPGMLAWAASLALAPRRDAQGGARRALWLFAASLLISVAAARVEAERYVMPILPAAMLLAADAALALASRVPGRVARVATPAVALLLVVPVAFTGIPTARSGGLDTQSAARRWLESTLGPADLLIREGYTGDPFSMERRAQMLRSRSFEEASPEMKRRVEARPARWVVSLPLHASGRFEATLVAPDGARRRVPLFAHPSDFTRAFYDLRLLPGADYVATSSAVRGRYAADTSRYAAEARFYRFVDDSLALAARFSASRDTGGPEIRIYRLTPRDWDRIDRARGTLPPLWWAESIPDAFREQVSAIRGDVADPLAPADSGGMPSPWLRALASFHRAKVEPFERGLMSAFAACGREARVAPLAEDVWRMHPEDTGACLDAVRAALPTRNWPRVVERVNRTLVLAPAGDPGIAELLVQRAFAQVQMGRTAAARADLEEAARLAPETTDTGRRARIGLSQVR